MKKLVGVLLVSLFVCSTPSLHAALTFQKGKIRDADTVAYLPVQDHFSEGVTAMNNQNWEVAYRHFNIIVLSYADTSYASDANYYAGLSLFNMGDYDLANQQFSQYLKNQNNPKFFEQTITHKFAIAEKFKDGARKRLFGSKMMPKWGSGKATALTTYDEVIAALPCHEIAAKALFAKGNLLWEMYEYKESIESFQMITRRFPKHELAPESYLTITEVFLDQSKNEFQNPDILALAQINLRRFKQDFPRDPKIQEAEYNVAQIKEVYATGLYDTGQFYERVKKPHASLLYYQNAINQFPDTDVAQKCKERLNALNKG